MIDQAVYQNSFRQYPTDGIHVIHPFTRESMVSKARSLAVYAMFDENRSRLPFRLAMEKAFGSAINLRQDKGHITAAYQQAARLKARYLEELLADGRLAKAGILDIDAVTSSLRRSASGIGGFDTSLIKIIGLELTIEATLQC